MPFFEQGMQTVLMFCCSVKAQKVYGSVALFVASVYKILQPFVWGACSSVVEALCYKAEGHGFYSQ
jgi:hypothetical protein